MPPLVIDCKKYVLVFLALCHNSFVRELSFRFNICIRVLTDITWYATTLLFFGVIYTYIADLKGWNIWELYLFIGTMIVIDSLHMSFFYFNVLRIPNYVRLGALDSYLLKPINTRFLISFQKINFGGLITLIFGVSVVLYAFLRLDLSLTAEQYLIYVLFIVVGVLLMYYVLFIGATLSIYFSKTEIFLESIFQIFQIGMRPDFIYNKLIQIIFTYIFPVLIIVNFPVKYLLQQLTLFEILWGFIFTIFLHCFSSYFWEISLKKYMSATS